MLFITCDVLLGMAFHGTLNIKSKTEYGVLVASVGNLMSQRGQKGNEKELSTPELYHGELTNIRLPCSLSTRVRR